MSFPIKHGGSFHSYVDVYQRVYQITWKIPGFLRGDQKEPGLPGQSDVVDRLTVISGGMEARPGEANGQGG